MLFVLLNQSLDQEVLRHEMNRSYSEPSIKRPLAFMLFDFLDTIPNVGIVPVLLQVGSHSQLEVLQRVNDYVPRGSYKPFGNVFGQLVLFILELVDELIQRVKQRVLDEGHFEASEN